jgi:Glycosyltransferase family 87
MKTKLWLLLSFLTVTVTWLYTVRVLRPWEHFVNVEHGNLKGEMGDLYSPWVGTRELLLHGSNPYGPEVSQQIQMAFYGHAIHQRYGGVGAKLIDEQRFAYPVYVVLLLAPTAYADFQKLQVWAAAILALLTAFSVLLWMDALRWRPPKAVTAAIVLFTLSSPQVMQGLRLRQLGLLVGFLVAMGAWCVIRNYLTLAGITLALSTIKPQMALLPLCCFLIWVMGDFARRWRLLASFLLMLLFLVGSGELILPGWIGYFLAGVAAYRKYLPTTAPLRVALGDMAGEILGAVIVSALLVFTWRSRKVSADSRRFTSLFAAFLTITILAFPLFPPFNQVMLILPVVLFLRDWNTLPKLWRYVFAFSVGWPWAIASVLLIFPPRLNSTSQLPLLPSFLVLFFPFFLSVLLLTGRGVASASQPGATDLSLP